MVDMGRLPQLACRKRVWAPESGWMAGDLPHVALGHGGMVW